MKDLLLDFAHESNAIERIFSKFADVKMRNILDNEFLCKTLTMETVIAFANKMGGELRDKPGLNVRIGNHIPPLGSEYVKLSLEDLLIGAHDSSPHETHIEFETLHPFTDGNGRTGRAIWLWMKIAHEAWDMRRSFLHEWYYESLEYNQNR